MDQLRAAHHGDAPTRAVIGLLVDPRLGPYLLGKTLSLAGLWGHNVASAVLAYGLTRSTLFVGLVSLAQFGPQLLFVGWSGAAADGETGCVN